MCVSPSNEHHRRRQDVCSQVQYLGSCIISSRATTSPDCDTTSLPDILVLEEEEQLSQCPAGDGGSGDRIRRIIG